MLMLAFAVCCWGLHYKLSLYHFGTTRAAGPAAKLLSPKERPISSRDVAVALPTSLQPQSSAPFPVFLIAAIAIGACCAPSNLIWAMITDAVCRQQTCVNSFCFLPRPPPAPPLHN